MQTTARTRTNLLSAAALWTLAAMPANLFGQPSVLTWHNDNARTGQNLQETILTPANVNAATFGKILNFPVDGRVNAQPLYVPSLAIPGQGTRNVLFVATEHSSMYAFDADTGAQLWQVSLLLSGETPSDDRGCGQVSPEIGITSTPVIDPQRGPSGTLYVVAMSKNGTTYRHRLHALDLATGAAVLGGPVEVQATYPGNGSGSSGGVLTFDPKQYKDRAALLLTNGILYTSWASHCDHVPYTAWVIGYNATNLSRVSVLNLVPNGTGGAIWNAGAGPAADAGGNLYLLTGNGTFDTTLTAGGFPVNNNYGNSIVKIASGGTSVADYFTMSNTVAESNADQDLGSGGGILLPTLSDAQGNPRELAVGTGKDGNIYVVDRANLGKFNAGSNNIYQQLTAAVGAVFSTPAWFNGTLYYGAVGDRLKAFRFSNGAFGASPTSQSTQSYPYPGATPSLSANGSSNGIVWTVQHGATAVLRAHDANNLATELYNSTQAPSNRDRFGLGNKYIVPTVANGKVYVGTSNSVAVFGQLCGAASLPQPVNNAAGVSLSPTLSWTAGTGATSYDVALSTANPPAIVATGLTGTSYSIGSPLVPGTKYYWFVVTHNCAGATQSPVWNFTVAGGQEIGFVEIAGNVNGNATVTKGTPLYVRGWAADTAAGAPVQSVTVLVDGASVGTATLGTSRADVAAAYSRSDFTNSGWALQASTNALSVGSHTVTAVATGPSGTATLTGSKTVNITAAQGQEIGFVEVAGNVSGNATVTKGTPLYVRGWAADTATGAPVQSVTVLVDGASVGTATLGASRADVAMAHGRSDFTNSGWTLQISTSAMSVGSHAVSAVATGPSGTATLSGTKTVTIAAPGQAIGFVEVAGNASGSAIVTKGTLLSIRGWAADTTAGAPVQSVTVLVDGASVGTATLGASRADVAAAYSRSDFTNSGWSLQVSTSALSVGLHAITATATGPSGTATLLGSRTVNITAAQVIGFVEVAGNVSGNANLTKGTPLVVRGWAADTAAGAPVQSVTVLVDGASVGTATLGASRADVASAYARSDFTNSGWNLQVSTAAMTLGQHTITAVATGASGTATLVGTRIINVQ